MRKLSNTGLKLTNKLPDKEGYYYFLDFGPNTPTIVYVKKEEGGFFAENEELSFVVSELSDENRELWCFIPNPTIDGKEVKLNSY